MLSAIEERAGEPGLAVAVIRDGLVVGQRCVGLASLSGRVPIAPDTRFHVVSVSKTFLAAAVLILAARGGLDLDDDVRRHLPELPAAPGDHGPVTIRHLLSMTSGLPDVLEIARLQGTWTSSPSRREELLALARAHAGTGGPPGAHYTYANVNPLLVEEVIARAGGMSAESFRRAALYEPLGLARTCARPHDGIALPGLAEPYVPDGAGGFTRATDLLGIAADPLTTTLDDLTRWLLALRSGTIGGVPVTARMAERTRLADGTPIHYGLGLAVRRYRGLTVLCHSGSQPGYKAHLAYVPAADVGLVILSNREDTPPAALAARIMDEIVGAAFPAPHPAGAATPGRREPATTYVDGERGEWVTIAHANGVLHGETLGDPFFLYQDADGGFRDGDDYRATVPVELRLEPDGGEIRLRLGGQPIELRRAAPPSYGGEALGAFAGRYERAGMARGPAVSVEGGTLVADYGGDGRRVFPMEPLAPDLFLVRPAAPGIAYRHVFRFERDPAGAVTGAVVTMERLKGLHLPRVAGAG